MPQPAAAASLNIAVDTAACPICGQANQCAIAAGQPAESCWCMEARISQSALASVPAASRGKACICMACGSRAEADPGSAVEMRGLPI